MRLLCFGGSFDPPHSGHDLLLREVQRQFSFDRIVVVPVNIPAHKRVDHDIDPLHRLEMARLAFSDIPSCSVDDREIQRGGVSYTYQTICELEAQWNPDEPITLLIGYDLVASLGAWRQWKQLKARVQFLIARRTTQHIDESLLEGVRWTSLDNPRVEVSSSRIRSLCSRGEDISEYVPRQVHRYIASRGLYGYNRPDTVQD